MSQHIKSYFQDLNLFDKDTLIEHCDRNGVRIATVPEYPHLVELVYRDDTVYDTKWNNFNRRCRGLIVDMENKEILAYPFDKFFNVDECDETKYDRLMRLGKFEVSEKLDGSLIIPFYDIKMNEIRTATKGNLRSEHAVYADGLLPEKVKDKALLQKYTLMFELISPKFKIVIDYKTKRGIEEGLYLVGIRHMMSGDLLSYDEVKEFAKKYGLKTINTFEFDSLDKCIDTAKGLPYTQEGFVLMFENGEMVKVKSVEYLKIHRFISNYSEKNLLELLMDKLEEHVIDECPEEYREDVKKTVVKYRTTVIEMRNDVYRFYSVAPKETRKDLALYVNKEVPVHLRRFLFDVCDNKEVTVKDMYEVMLKYKMFEDMV